ncbi:unnamed protein product, partial [Owenia fusiformis]
MIKSRICLEGDDSSSHNSDDQDEVFYDEAILPKSISQNNQIQSDAKNAFAKNGNNAFKNALQNLTNYSYSQGVETNGHVNEYKIEQSPSVIAALQNVTRARNEAQIMAGQYPREPNMANLMASKGNAMQLNEHNQQVAEQIPYAVRQNNGITGPPRNISPQHQQATYPYNGMPDQRMRSTGIGSPPGIANASSTGTAKIHLCNQELWQRFHQHTTEMIITKQGRRMFPVFQLSVSGLDPQKHYNVFVDMIVADPNHWKFQAGKWTPCGQADQMHHNGRVYLHPD